MVQDAENFEELLEESLKKSYDGGRFVSGEVIKVTPQELFVDIGRKYTGICQSNEFLPNGGSEDEIANIVKVGDKFDFVITRVDDGAAAIYLSRKKAIGAKDWDGLDSVKESKTVLKGIVKKAIKAGILVGYKSLLVFIPASQTGCPRNFDYAKMVNSEVEYILIDVDKNERRLVGSIRAAKALDREAKLQEFFANVKVGDKFCGKVKSIVNYGIFVGIGVIDGLVHISDLSWKRVSHPSEVVKVGDDVEVYVKKIDLDGKKVLLSMKREEYHPYFEVCKEFPVGKEFETTVCRTSRYGVFVEITDAFDALIHSSKLNGKNWPKIGDKVKCVVAGLDNEKKRVILDLVR